MGAQAVTAWLAIESKQEVLLRSLEKYYEDDKAFARFRQVVAGDAGARMSLRVLDWLVTNYSKKHNVVYPVGTSEYDAAFNMFIEYKSQLRAYSKKYFDPFCRRDRIVHRGVETTCGQLNFFRWALLHGVLDYATKHHDEIEQDMLASIEHRSPVAGAHVPSKIAKTSRKRQELNKAAIKTATTTVVRVKVRFS